MQPWFGQDVGQLPSQSSPASTTPLPHTGVQSTSVIELHTPPAGQHASPVGEHDVMVPTSTHCRWHPEPCSWRWVHPWFGQLAGQLPSQVSPDSMTPLPHAGAQLLSLVELQVPRPPPGQQLSLFAHAVWLPAF